MGDRNGAVNGANSTSLMALLNSSGVLRGSFCFVYFCSEWTTPVDAVVLPFIKQRLASNEPFVQVKRQDDAVHEFGENLRVASSTSAFRGMCRDMGVTRLPMLVMVNELSRQRPEHPNLAIQQLMEAMRRTPNVHDWGIPIGSACPPLDSESPALVKLREDAMALFEQGDLTGGATGFTRVLLHCPTCPKANFNMAVILQMMEELYLAVEHMLQVVTENDHDAVAHTVLRTVLHPAEPALVVAGYVEIVTHHPDHYRAAHSLATIRGEATTAAPAYVRQVFDHLAESFEETLVTHLEYRVPWQIVEALQRADALPTDLEHQTFTVVDLGCGTGLCGRLLRPFASHIAGIDLSPLMIEKTRDSGFYDEAETADILPYLSTKTDSSLDLVVSADVWIYVGALEEIFLVVAQKLRPRGWFAFSTELLARGDGFQLASSGRFQHSDACIASLAAQYGFTIAIQQDITVRKESGEPIAGRVFILQRPESA